MKAWQRVIRESRANGIKSEFIPDIVDIKKSICREISYETAEKIILQYEWLGTMGTTQYHYGIYFDDVLAGVVCFGYFQSLEGYATYVGDKYDKKGIQLSRGACTHWAHEHSASKLISFGLREMAKKGYKYVVAFSDPEAGEIGTVYQATNWYYLGSTNHSPHWDVYYKNSKLYMNDRDFWKKYNLYGQDALSEWLNDKPDLILKKRENKSRYIKLIGSKLENKEMLSVLQRKIKPYPKRDSDIVMDYEINSDNLIEKEAQALLL